MRRYRYTRECPFPAKHTFHSTAIRPLPYDVLMARHTTSRDQPDCWRSRGQFACARFAAEVGFRDGVASLLVCCATPTLAPSNVALFRSGLA